MEFVWIWDTISSLCLSYLSVSSSVCTEKTRTHKAGWCAGYGIGTCTDILHSLQVGGAVQHVPSMLFSLPAPQHSSGSGQSEW